MSSKSDEVFNKVKVFGFLFTLITTVYVSLSVMKDRGILEWVTNSDQTSLPVFVDEIIENFDSYSGWMIPRSPLFFPDVASYFFFSGVINLPSIIAIALSAVPTLFAFTWMGEKLINSKGTNVAALPYFVAVWTLVIFPFLLCMNFGEVNFWLLKYYFTFGNHFSSAVAAIITIYWLHSCNSNGLTKKIVISVLLFLTSASNLIFLIFLFPALAIYSVSLGHNRSGAAERNSKVKISIIIASLVLGNFSRQLFNTASFQPVGLSPSVFFKSFERQLSDLVFISRTSFVMTLIFILLLFAYAKFLYDCLVHAQKKDFLEYSRTFRFSIYFSALISFLASTLSWENAGSSRYLVYFFIAPLLFAPRFVFRSLMVLGFSIKVNFLKISVGALISVSLLATVSTPIEAARSFTNYADTSTEKLHECLGKLGGTKGLAGYWSARKIQFLSGNAIRLSQLAPYETTPQTLLFYWANNIFDYYNSRLNKKNFNYILMDDLNPSTIEMAFGRPDKKSDCGAHRIWLYFDELQLTSTLVRNNSSIMNANLKRDNDLTFPASFFSSLNGDYAGSKIINKASSNGAVPILFGQYLDIKPGYLMFRLNYKISGAPKGSPDASLYFDLTTNFGQEILFSEKLPTSNGTHSKLIKLYLNEFNAKSDVEPRIIASKLNKVIQVDSITIKQSRTIR